MASRITLAPPLGAHLSRRAPTPSLGAGQSRRPPSPCFWMLVNETQSLTRRKAKNRRAGLHLRHGAPFLRSWWCNSSKWVISTSLVLLPLRSGTCSFVGRVPVCCPSRPSVGPLVKMLHPVRGGRIIAFRDNPAGGSVAVVPSPPSHCYAQPVALAPPPSHSLYPLPIMMEYSVVETKPPV